MNVHLKNAGRLLARAVLPDRAIAGFVNAALDGTGKQSKLQGALKGLKEDAFELASAPVKIVKELSGK